MNVPTLLCYGCKATDYYEVRYMFARILALRGQLKKLKSSLKAFGLVLKTSPLGTYTIARVTKVNLLTIHVDLVDEDLETVMQSCIVFIGDIMGINELSIENVRQSLIINNPDLALDYTDCEDWLDDCEFVDIEEDQE